MVLRLVLAALAAGGVGVLFAALWAATLGFDGARDAVVAQALKAFAEEPWRWVPHGAGAAVGLAVLLSGAEGLASRLGRRRALHFDRLRTGSLREAVAEVRLRVERCLEGGRGDVIRGFDELVRGAIAISASDLHVSPTPEGVRLTYRVDGVLHPVSVLDAAVAPLLATRVKVLARLDTYVRGTPQDGRLVIHVDGAMVEARVSTLPTESGERLVLRFVRGSRSVPDLASLGFSEAVLARLLEVLSRSQGLFLLTAPVGSGKTTTLYAALKLISETRGSMTSMVTLEDPVELELPFATQTQMHPRAGMTFASTLRSVLRQDPNVLMVGEIRDHETAEIAMQAGLTGHLILTTVHGDSAAGPFARLIEMRVEPFILASASIGCLSQRLVRALCTACRRPAEPEPHVIDRFARHGVTLPAGTYYAPAGCEYCEGQGYAGRVPIAELLMVDAEIRRAIAERQPTDVLHRLAVERGMIPLIQDGLRRAACGETSLVEVLRVVG